MGQQIGEKVREVMLDLIDGLLRNYQESMDFAYLQCDDEPLKVSIGLKLEPGDRGVDIEASISFVTGKIKDKVLGTANESQRTLFDESNKTHLEMPDPETIPMEEPEC